MKAAIIINPDLPTGLLANAIACITSGLFTNGKDLVGSVIQGSDVSYIPITKIPILILKPGKIPLIDLCRLAQKKELKFIAFTKEAQTTTNYKEYEKRVKDKSLNDVSVVGLGILGEEKTVNAISGNLPMLR